MRTWPSVIAAGICCLFLTASMANAATIYACRKKVGGAIRIVGASTTCLATERKMSWPDTAEVTALKNRLVAVESLLQHFTRNGNDISITGANLWIKSGSGATDGGGTVNGLGNLIVGYNEARGAGDDRTGSHNLIIGSQNNYASFGGLVAGYLNTVSGTYSSVSGGNGNTASGHTPRSAAEPTTPPAASTPRSAAEPTTSPAA